MSKKHEHNFVAEKYQTQELDSKYAGNQKYQSATLEQEQVLIFCTTCGESRKITEKAAKPVQKS